MMQNSFFKNTWPGFSLNWPCLKFICTACTEDNRSKGEVAMSGRVRVLEETILSMDQKLSGITELLTEVKVKSNQEPTYADRVKGNVQPSGPSLIVIEKSEQDENNESSKEKLTEVTKAAIEVKAGINRAFTTNAGHTVLVCSNEKSKRALLPHVENVYRERKINTPKPRVPTISVPFLTRKYETEELRTILDQQNGDNGISFSEDNAKVLFTVPMKHKDGYHQAVIRVSESTRKRIDDNGNRLFIGLNSFPVYDRFFIKRCNRCQGLHHFQTDGTGGCKKKKVCAMCSGEHDTIDCRTDSDHYRCINCVNGGKDEFCHAAYDPQCATYCAEQDKLKKTINYYSKNT